MGGTERPALYEVNGRTRCELSLYDARERVVGRALWWDDEKEAKLGSARVPRAFEIIVDLGGSSPVVQVTVEIVKQVPRPTAVAFHVKRTGDEVMAKHLKEVRLTDWVDAAIANVAREVIALPGGVLRARGRTVGGERAAKTAIKLGRSRARITTEFLAEVAEVYRENFDKPVVAVERHFRVGYRTAAGYVEQARAEGLLPPTTRGKKRL